MYYVYLLECADGSIYTGISDDVTRRFRDHKEGKGGHYTSARGAKKIIYTEACGNRSNALKREIEIKRWPRSKKLNLIKKSRI